ncbi:MAG: flagellar hook-length control protein FliK [Bdellovibrionales bacterium]|nr:flagellar hook-length control protein FliK [Bdellovibrionales bacterium]
MNIQGVDTLLKSDKLPQQTRQRSEDLKVFKDILTQKHSKVTEFNNQKDSYKLKERHDDDLYAGQVTDPRHENMSTYKRDKDRVGEGHQASRREPQAHTQKGQTQHKEEASKATGPVSSRPEDSQEVVQQKDNFIVGESEKINNTGLSLNISDALNKTLEKNEIQDFEQQLNQMLDQKALELNESFKGVGTPKADKLAAALNSIQQETAGLEGEGSAELQSLIGGQDLQSLAQDQTQSGGEESTDMNFFPGQGAEQNFKVDAKDNFFLEKLQEVDGSAGKNQKIDNLNSIVKQARAFIHDGGGEMRMELAPEGLGKVHLKVAVDNGQVNIEMLADNNMAKKALEQGLAEIKASLENHKLLVENFKVEMSQDYQRDFSDLANHMQEQENREFAQQFLGEFRQQREERLGGVFDGFRGLRDKGPEPSLSLNHRRQAYQENGKGRGLDIVA